MGAKTLPVWWEVVILDLFASKPEDLPETSRADRHHISHRHYAY